MGADKESNSTQHMAYLFITKNNAALWTNNDNK